MGDFQASEKDIRIAVSHAIRTLLEEQHAGRDFVIRNYARLKELHVGSAQARTLIPQNIEH
jgi:hypothetical protein